MQLRLFPDRNLDTSQTSGSRDLAPPLLRQVRLNFGSGLLMSAHPSHQTSSTFNEGPEKTPFPSQGSQVCSHNLCQPEQLSPSAHLHAECPHKGHFLASYFRVFDVVLCGLPGASYSINSCVSLAFTSILSHPLTPLLTPLLTPFHIPVLTPLSNLFSNLLPHLFSPILSHIL